jgi:dTDP-4-dehydrorhamnose 3,5-epimerase
MDNKQQTPPTITPFEVQTTDIDGLYIITMKQIAEDRGVIRELFRGSAFAGAGIGGFAEWKQINATESKQGVIRGMHGEEMTKLVSVVSGRALGAYVDIRSGSRTRGNVVTVELEPGKQVLVPKGVCNGFQSVSEGISQYLYCFDQEWVLGMKGYSVNPLDPALGIDWPIPVAAGDEQLISRKDAAAQTLKEALESTV